MAAAASSPSVSACKPRAAAKMSAAPTTRKRADERDVFERTAFDGAERPVHEIGERAGIWREIERERDQAAGEAGKADADQHQARRPARRPSRALSPAWPRPSANTSAASGANAAKPNANAITAPSAAKPESPSTPESASGLRNKPCSAAPDKPERGADEPSGERARKTDFPDDGARGFVWRERIGDRRRGRARAPATSAATLSAASASEVRSDALMARATRRRCASAASIAYQASQEIGGGRQRTVRASRERAAQRGMARRRPRVHAGRGRCRRSRARSARAAFRPGVRAAALSSSASVRMLRPPAAVMTASIIVPRPGDGAAGGEIHDRWRLLALRAREAREPRVEIARDGCAALGMAERRALHRARSARAAAKSGVSPTCRTGTSKRRVHLSRRPTARPSCGRRDRAAAPALLPACRAFGECRARDRGSRNRRAASRARARRSDRGRRARARIGRRNNRAIRCGAARPAPAARNASAIAQINQRNATSTAPIPDPGVSRRQVFWLRGSMLASRLPGSLQWRWSRTRRLQLRAQPRICTAFP